MGEMLQTSTKLSSSPTFFLSSFFQLKILLAWPVFPNSQSSQESQSIWHYCHLGNSKPLKNAFCGLDLWKPFELWWVLKSTLKHSVLIFSIISWGSLEMGIQELGWIFSPRQHACQEAWFIWALQRGLTEQANMSVHSAVLRQLVPEAMGLPISKCKKVWARACLKVGHTVAQLATGWVTDLSHLEWATATPTVYLPLLHRAKLDQVTFKHPPILSYLGIWGSTANSLF